MLETLPYLLASVALSVLAVVVAVRIYSANPRRELRITSLIIGGGIVWLLMSALEVTSSNFSVKLFFEETHFLGLVLVPTPFLLLAMLISGYEKYVNRKTIAVLTIVPVISLLLVFTSEYQKLIWTNVRLDAVNPLLPLDVTYGVGYWVVVVGYSYALLLIGSIMIARRIMAERRLYRLQAFALMLVIAVPLALDVIHLFYPSFSGYVAATPVSLIVAVSILMWRLIYLPRLDVVPVAHEMIIDNMKDAVIVLDWEKRVVDLNPSARALLGHSLHEAVAQPIENLWTEWPALKKASDTGANEVKFEIGGKQQIYELQSSRLARLGTTDAINTLIILRNITDRKNMEAELRLYSEHLEELVLQRTKELREAERMAAIGETAAMVGHDLRNPLQGIAGAVHVLKRKLGSTADSETVEMLALIKSSIGYADNIVKDLMDYSREIRLEPTETSAKTVTEAALLQVKIPENVTVRNLTQETPRIILDNAKMQRVFANLLRNAVDAMPNGGQVTLSSSESNGVMEVQVTDTGEGVSDSAMQNLWRPFKTTKSKGTGLGLAICKRILEAHGGAIKVESTIGVGSTFTVTIPINPSANMPQPKPENEAASSRWARRNTF